MNYNLCYPATSESALLTVCYRKKQNDTSFHCLGPVIDNEFCHNIVKVVCGSTRLLPYGFTATLTML